MEGHDNKLNSVLLLVRLDLVDIVEMAAFYHFLINNISKTSVFFGKISEIFDSYKVLLFFCF